MAQKKATSTITRLWFAWTPESAEEFSRNYVDLSQCLSIVNRRGYRQATNYAVANIKFAVAYPGVPGPQARMIDVQAIPKSWTVDNSLTKAYHAWQSQQREAMKGKEGAIAKYHDFKIFADSAHAEAGITRNLIPLSHVGDGVTGDIPYEIGEWVESKLVWPNDDEAIPANESTMHAVGPNFPVGPFNAYGLIPTTSISLVDAYAEDRLHPDTTPQIVPPHMDDNPYSTLSLPDHGSDEVIEDAVQDNDTTPYENVNYAAGDVNANRLELVSRMYPLTTDLTINPNIGHGETGPFVAPMGLLRINTVNHSAFASFVMCIDLVPGSYKGILAERGV